MSETGIMERLRDRDSVHRVLIATEEAAQLIERQQKAIDLLLIAVEPFAKCAEIYKGFDDDYASEANTAGQLRAARSAKEQAVRILNQQRGGL